MDKITKLNCRKNFKIYLTGLKIHMLVVRTDEEMEDELPEIWNLHQRTLNGEDRANNNAEAAHRRLKYELGMQHPTIWKLIDALRNVQIDKDAYYERLLSCHEPPQKL